MLNSQLCMPENEAIKQRLIKDMMVFNPGLGSMKTNYVEFQQLYKKALSSQLFTDVELIGMSEFWRTYRASKWLNGPH